MHRIALAALLVAPLAACNKGQFQLGQGEEVDGRLTSDVYTWDCQTPETNWMGVFGFDVTLEFVPDEIASRNLPPSGCNYGLSMFAIDTPTTGHEIPDIDDPHWASAEDEGILNPVIEGLWYADVFKNVFSCNQVDSVITDGIVLSNAGLLDGAVTPEAGEVTLVSVDSDYETGIPFGEELQLDWNTSGWEESFVQIRRVRGGTAYETLTCNTTGMDSFTIDDDEWGFFAEEVSVDLNYVYVGFRNTEVWESPDGLKIDVATRALHVVGVVDL